MLDWNSGASRRSGRESWRPVNVWTETTFVNGQSTPARTCVAQVRREGTRRRSIWLGGGAVACGNVAAGACTGGGKLRKDPRRNCDSYSPLRLRRYSKNFRVSSCFLRSRASIIAWTSDSLMLDIASMSASISS